MVAVALIGVDGAGKTTIANRLLEQYERPLKYLYMGTAVASSNVTLPTSRLMLWLKTRRHRHADGAAPFVEHPNIRRGSVFAAFSLVHRVAEEWYRQFASWWFQVRGYVVLYDRHFLFEHAIDAAGPARLTDRIHHKLLYSLYPRPDLTLFLDAPMEIVQQRKREQPAERLEQYRQAALALGRTMQNFVRIDATRAVDEVYADVAGRIDAVCAKD